MKKQQKNLLPKKVSKGVAPTSGLSKIKPRVLFSKALQKKLKRFRRLTNLSAKITFALCLLFFLSGYYPAWSFPPIKAAHVLAAADVQTQSQEISAAAFLQPLSLPHPGYISTHFSDWHPGIDIATALGTQIHPISAGVVDAVGFDIFGLGNFVEVDHQNGFKSKYAHMARYEVRVGDKVSSDNVLGEVGLTGHTSGPHTHLEVTHNGKYVDPQLLLPQLSDIPKPEYLSGASPASGSASQQSHLQK